MSDIFVKQLVTRDGYEEKYWVFYYFGDFRNPIMILTDYEAQALAKRITEQKEDESDESDLYDESFDEAMKLQELLP
jgi:hypothetical protein